MLYDIIASVKNKRILNRKKHVYEKNLLNDNRAVRKYNMEVAVLKKLVTVLGAFFAVLLACPLSVFAAEGSKAPSTVPVWLCIPFAGLLLCIAVMPLVKAEWWESHQPLVVALWIILMVVPFAFVYGAGKTAETVLDCIVNDYLTFIILLFGLFCVSGNITMEGDFAGSPRVNVGLLALGTLLSSCIGTTGASMLMVRPVIKMNSWRKRKGHIMIFFIFMVSNMGGCLTPIGDPPLLMGFMRGVPFFWSLHLFPVLIFNMVILLFVFYQIDKRSYRKDIANGRKPDIRKPGTQFRLDGLHNIIFLVMIVGAVILSGVLPGMSAFQDAAGNVRGIHLFGEVTLTFPALIEIVIILLAAFLSFKTTDKQIRIRNHFTWGAIQSFFTMGQPHLFTKFFAMKDHKTMFKAILLGTAGMFFSATLIEWAGVNGIASIQNIEKADQIIPMILQRGMNPFLASIFIAGIVAAGMSTIDGILVTTTGAVTRDIYQKIINKNATDEAVMSLSKVVTVIIGIVVICFGVFQPGSIFEINLFAFSGMAIFVVPILFGIYWKKATAKGAIASVIVGIISLLLFTLNPSVKALAMGFHALFPTTIIASIVMIVVSKFTETPPQETIDRHFTV